VATDDRAEFEKRARANFDAKQRHTPW
jgi:hypothetical protein